MRRFFFAQDVPTFNPSVMPSHKEIYFFHVEAGMRIYELYSLLDGRRPDGTFSDKGDAEDLRSLASEMKREGSKADYSGPWALQTMGGAGGQTIVGAFMTGTHGLCCIEKW